MNFTGTLKIILKIGLVICAALLGSQGQPSAAPPPNPYRDLPMTFSPSYQIAFSKIPDLTAHRFLQAYDGLAKYGPVTSEAVYGHTLLHTLIEDGQGRGGILAADINAEGFVVSIVFETRSAFSLDNANRLAGILVFDEANDNLMTLDDAIHFGQDLFELPIERFLMIFDMNADGHLKRAELMMALEVYAPEFLSL